MSSRSRARVLDQLRTERARVALGALVVAHEGGSLSSCPVANVFGTAEHDALADGGSSSTMATPNVVPASEQPMHASVKVSTSEQFDAYNPHATFVSWCITNRGLFPFRLPGATATDEALPDGR